MLGAGETRETEHGLSQSGEGRQSPGVWQLTESGRAGSPGTQQEGEGRVIADSHPWATEMDSKSGDLETTSRTENQAVLGVAGREAGELPGVCSSGHFIDSLLYFTAHFHHGPLPRYWLGED